MTTTPQSAVELRDGRVSQVLAGRTPSHPIGRVAEPEELDFRVSSRSNPFKICFCACIIDDALIEPDGPRAR